MKQVSIFGSGLALPLKGQDITDSVALVPQAKGLEDSRLIATLQNLPCYSCEQVFSLSPQAIRVVPTIRQMLRLGRGVYQPLHHVRLENINWPQMRGIQAELVTAYLLARAFGATRINWYVKKFAELPPVAESAKGCLSQNGIEIDFRFVS